MVIRVIKFKVIKVIRIINDIWIIGVNRIINDIWVIGVNKAIYIWVIAIALTALSLAFSVIRVNRVIKLIDYYSN